MGWVAKNGVALRLTDAEDDTRFRPRPDQKKPIRSFLAVPLIEQSVCVGVLSVASDEPAKFTVEHEEILQLVAGVCGPHVRSVRISRLAGADPLTGVLSATKLDDAFPDAEGLVLVDPLSVAIAERREGEKRDSLLARAQRALDAAMHRGNKVEFA